jgi:O-antigen/teichoic acid export membrane protein
MAGAVALYLLCRSVEEEISRPALPTRQALTSLAATGGWMTLANLSGALLGYADRFLVSAALPLSVVARYLTPQDAMMRLTILPTALASALFPAVTHRFAQDSAAVRHLVHRSMDYTWLTLFPITLLAAALAPEIVTLWLGSAFAIDAPVVMQWMALGVLANGLALTPFTLLQASGRVKLAALLQLVQLPLLVLALVMALRTGGAPAAAACVAARLLIDCLILVAVSHRVLPGTHRYVLGTTLALLASSAAFAGFTLIQPIGQRLVLFAVALGLFLPGLWATGVLQSLPGAQRLRASHP